MPFRKDEEKEEEKWVVLELFKDVRDGNIHRTAIDFSWSHYSKQCSSNVSRQPRNHKANLIHN